MWICGLVALWGSQFCHALLGGWRRPQQVSLAKVVLVGPLVFLSSWWLLTPTLGLAAWAFWLGDNDHWFWDSVPVFSGIAAALFALLVFGRLILTRCNDRFANVQLALSIACMITMGGVQLSHVLSRVDGWTADAAVTNIVANNPGFEAAEVELVDSTLERRQYRVMLEGEQRATVSVKPVLQGLGWSHSSSSWRGTAADELADLRSRAVRMQHYKDPIHLRDSLQQFLHDHPDTPESAEVEQWLAGVEPEVARIKKAQDLGGRLFLLRRLPQLMRENVGQPVDLTREQQLAVEVFRLMEVDSLEVYYSRFTCEHRNEAVAALRELGANDAADWLADVNRRIEPYLDESGSRIRPQAREAASRAVRPQALRMAEFADDILNRLIIYCDDNSSHFQPLRGD